MTRLSEQRRAQRNLNPHKAAVAAMWLWGKRYSQQKGGSMDFWDSLTASEQGTCRNMVKQILNAPEDRP